MSQHVWNTSDFLFKRIEGVPTAVCVHCGYEIQAKLSSVRVEVPELGEDGEPTGKNVLEDRVDQDMRNANFDPNHECPEEPVEQPDEIPAGVELADGEQPIAETL